jgi:hypothetical protein
MRYLLIDLHRIPDPQITDRARGNPSVALSLLALKHGDRPDLEARLETWKGLAHDLARHPAFPAVIPLLIEYLLTVSELRVEALTTFARRNMGPDTEKVIETTAQRLHREGREAGRAEGRDEGREEGRVAGREEGREEGRAEGREEGRRALRRLLTRLLHLRFGEVPRATLDQLLAGDAPSLEQRCERAAVVASIEELLDR